MKDIGHPMKASEVHENREPIPLIRPFMNDAIKEKVCEVLDSGYLTEGAVTKEFESAIRDYVGCKHAIAFSSCTTGLEVALRAVGIGPGDEVIVPDYTYPATADVVRIVGAKVVLVDISKETMLIDYEQIEKAITPKTRAVIPVSIFGNPLDYERLNRLKSEYGLVIIEDAACSLGAAYKGTKVGNLADISVFSLHPRKFITTGEGGILTTNNSAWADWILSYKHFGLKPDPTSRFGTSFQMIGTNYKLSDVLAAIGLVQMNFIDVLLKRRLELAENYLALLNEIPGLILPCTTPGGVHSRQSFCVFLDKRDHVMKIMRESNIEVQIGTYSLHLQPAFSGEKQVRICGKLKGSKYAFNNCLTLPLYHDLTSETQRYIVDQLRRII